MPDGAREKSTALIPTLTYAGRLSEADALLVALGKASDTSPDLPFAARVPALRGLYWRLAGQLTPAAQSYREAARLCDELHDIHGQTAAVFNLGCVLAETGQFGEALDAFRRAVLPQSWPLGIVTDLALALYNTGLLFLQLGDLEAARRTARRLRNEANAAKAEAFFAFASSLDADIARRQAHLASPCRFNSLRIFGSALLPRQVAEFIEPVFASAARRAFRHAVARH